MVEKESLREPFLENISSSYSGLIFSDGIIRIDKSNIVKEYFHLIFDTYLLTFLN